MVKNKITSPLGLKGYMLSAGTLSGPNVVAHLNKFTRDIEKIKYVVSNIYFNLLDIKKKLHSSNNKTRKIPLIMEDLDYVKNNLRGVKQSAHKNSEKIHRLQLLSCADK